ncbi:unnamed protein product [Musa acuminata subsp. malaccensis]|uniref:(wild Malaysian banana) hypothetical protein n=1 Tax=Musa acuminata subsp. malaccensis TaxID=214687 RepID=A0A8D7EY96_MUSAM|nr:unnamed protein product [Musa acuminata subsp. malaccensis]
MGCPPAPNLEASGDPRQGPEVALDDGVDEHPRLLRRIPRRHVDHVGFHHHRASASVVVRVERGHGTVVGEAVLAAHHPEAENVALVVKDLEALRAGGRRQAGDDAHLPQGADVAVPHDDVAALHEVLVRLRPVEAPYHRPHRRHRRRHRLHHRRAALVRPHRVLVVPRHRLRHLVRRAKLGRRNTRHRFASLLFLSTESSKTWIREVR